MIDSSTNSPTPSIRLPSGGLFFGFFPRARHFWGSPPKHVRDLICGLTERVAARILMSLGCYHFLSLYVLKIFFVVVIFSYII